MSFLDVLLMRCNGKLETTIFRKEANNDICLHWRSFAPMTWKKVTKSLDNLRLKRKKFQEHLEAAQNLVPSLSQKMRILSIEGLDIELSSLYANSMKSVKVF